MAASWIERARQFKSPLAVVNGFLLRSRETHVRRAEEKSLRIQQLNKQIKQQQKNLEQRDEQLAKKDAEIVRLKAENERLRKQPLSLPEDPPLPHHTFGPRMISLCVNLARRIGLRAAADVLPMFVEWLGVSLKLPTWTCIRTWLLRAGVAALQQPVEAADDWIWMADHSNQIGQEKVLSIIGLRASHMPPAGEAIRHEHVRVLELVPGTQWKREDVARVYEQLAQRCGAPAAVLVDGAAELRESAEVLQKYGKNTIVLGDFKHHVANLLKKMLESDERFSEFTTQIGRTRSATQQTELAHFTPPSPRPKARFMNLAPQLHWGKMASWHVSHPDSQSRHGITAERMNEKLGWLSAFRDDIARWNACQDVVSESITWINEQGLSQGATGRLRDHLRHQRAGRGPEIRHSPCRKLTAQILRFVREQESKLTEGQRLPLSTEILESSFGRFKQLERQHSKGGLTSLLAAYGCLFHTATPDSIRADFARVSVKAMRAWVKDNLKTTLTSRRQTAFEEFRLASASSS